MICEHYDCKNRNEMGCCTVTACINPKYNGSGTITTAYTSSDVYAKLTIGIEKLNINSSQEEIVNTINRVIDTLSNHVIYSHR